MRPPEKRFFPCHGARSVYGLFGLWRRCRFLLLLVRPLSSAASSVAASSVEAASAACAPSAESLPPSVPLMHLKMSQDQLPLLRAPPLVSFAASPRCGRQWRLNLAPFCNQHAADLRRRWRRSWLNPLCTPVAAELRRRFLLWV